MRVALSSLVLYLIFGLENAKQSFSMSCSLCTILDHAATLCETLLANINIIDGVRLLSVEIRIQI